MAVAGDMLDALNRRRKFVGRQPIGRRIDLSSRDLAYFAALERHGPLSAPLLFDLTKHLAANERGHKDRLTVLYHETKTAHGGPYLERPEQQWAHQNARYLPMTYEHTKFAARALREAGIPPQIATPPSGPYLHRFMTARITAEVELHVKAAGHRFIPSGDVLHHPKCPEATRQATNPLSIRVSGRTIIPDALYGIDYGGKFRFWALEADRGTEPLKGRGLLNCYLRDKIEAYCLVLRMGLFQQTWGIPILTVKFVCESETRADNLRDLIQEVTGDGLRAAKFEVSYLEGKHPACRV